MTREETQTYIKESLPVKREVTDIVIHCSDTIEGRNFYAHDIDLWHKQRGFRKIGYHFVIDLDGTIEQGRPLREVGAHVKDYNKCSIGICYIGGLDQNKKAKDTRTDEQKDALRFLLQQLVSAFPTVRKIAGHRDYSPDKNGNGIVDKFERLKECPCFDAIPEYQDLLYL
jgi:N-acetyl-anhydromuramyl-L-alanine amidase AmpD